MSEKRIRFSIKQWRQVRGLSQEADPMRSRLITLLKICEVLKVNSSDIIVDTEKEK